nr:cytochrome c biogenesis protein ResB [Nocardioides sp. TF02-7]
MRTALILLALLALAAIPGSLFPQRNVATDPAAVQQYFQKHPDLAPWLDRIGFFDVYASAWFAAVYVLLLISMTGCVLPRSLRLWRSVRSAPPPAPRNLARMEDHHAWQAGTEHAEILDRAARHLRTRRFRVVVTGTEVRAERGYLREVGNLSFHLSLLVLLVGIAAGKLMGFEGRVAVAEGGTFVNDRSPVRRLHAVRVDRRRRP